MNPIRIGRILHFGWQGLSRNFWLSLIAVVTVSLTVMSVSVFTVLNIALSETTQSLEDQLDVSIFIKEAAAEPDVLTFVGLLNERTDTKDVIYNDKAKAEAEFRALNEGEDELLSVISDLDNPFPRYIQVRADDPQSLSEINDFVIEGKFSALVEETSFQKTREEINGFVNFSKFIMKNSIVISIFFVLISVLVVFNIIRLAIFSRRNEIQIMRFVGASYQLIRMPFVVEGAIMGAMAAVISLILLYLLSQWEATQIPLYFTGATWNPITLYTQYFWVLMWSNFGFGMLLAASISYLAVHKYLNESYT